MKVKVLVPTAALKAAKVGETIEIDAKVGNDLACRGIVRVLEHDPPAGKSAKVKEGKPETK